MEQNSSFDSLSDYLSFPTFMEMFKGDMTVPDLYGSLINISIKLLIVDQEAEIKNINKEISEIDSKIEKKLTDISYSTRPQILEQINQNKFKFLPILQSDIIRTKAD